MTDESEPELRDLVRRARAGLGPSAADAARVRAGVATVLAGRASDALGRKGDGSGESTSLRTLVKLGLVAAVAAAAGAGGYVFGYRAGMNERERARLSEPTAVIQLPVRPAVETSGTAEAPALDVAPLPVSEQPAAAPSPHPARSNTTSAPQPSAPAAQGAPTGESSLELEARLLARVERALRDKNPRLALGLLGELDREVPGGELEEERAAGRVMAHCMLGTPYATKLATNFASRHPTSAYAARIADACAEPGDAGE